MPLGNVDGDVVTGGATSTVTATGADVPDWFWTESVKVVVLVIFVVSVCANCDDSHAATGAPFALQPGNETPQKNGVPVQLAVTVTGPPGGGIRCGARGGTIVQRRLRIARPHAVNNNSPQPFRMVHGICPQRS